MLLNFILNNILIVVFIFSFILLIPLMLFFILPWLFGAPYEPTEEQKIKKIIKLAEISKKDKVADLGSGDGRIVIEMAKAGAKESHGFEINPILVWLSRRKIKKLGLEKKAFIHWKNFWKTSFKEYNVVVLFQFSTIMNKLKRKLKKELKKNSKIISYYWKFPKWKPVKTKENIYLYIT